MTDYVRTLVSLVPDANVSYTGVNPDYMDIAWSDSRPQSTREECDAAWPAIEAANAEQAVKRSRSNAYQIEADPLFFGWQRDENTQEEWLNKVQEIRDRYPYAI